MTPARGRAGQGWWLVGVSVLLVGFLKTGSGMLAGYFDGERAYQDIETLVSFGPRPPSSRGHQKAQEYLLAELERAGLEVHRDAFEADTPLGPIPMANLIAIHAGEPERILVVAGHYDTKRFDDFPFVGANDGGSSAAVVVELARAVSAGKDSFRSTIWFVLFDGEEAIVRWTDRDSLYGSRHLASRLAREGTLEKIRALILVDMVGDRDLEILKEGYSTRWLQDLVWRTAEELGNERHFSAFGYPVADDHVPFIERGVAAVDLIDFDYGPANTFWHSADDALDKLSAASLRVVGETVLAVLAKLDRMP